MIITFLINIACSLITGLFSAFNLLTLPVELIHTLFTILAYGNWVVGADVLLIFSGSVVFWWGVNWSVGLFIWVYEHIPFIG